MGKGEAGGGDVVSPKGGQGLRAHPKSILANIGTQEQAGSCPLQGGSQAPIIPEHPEVGVGMTQGTWERCEVSALNPFSARHSPPITHLRFLRGETGSQCCTEAHLMVARELGEGGRRRRPPWVGGTVTEGPLPSHPGPGVALVPGNVSGWQLRGMPSSWIWGLLWEERALTSHPLGCCGCEAVVLKSSRLNQVSPPALSDMLHWTARPEPATGEPTRAARLGFQNDPTNHAIGHRTNPWLCHPCSDTTFSKDI